MADDDPSLDIRLALGSRVRPFRIVRLGNGRSWAILGGAGIQIAVTDDHDAALKARQKFDREIAALIAHGWTPAP